MEKVFVSGGSGFISLHLISKLIQEGYVDGRFGRVDQKNIIYKFKSFLNIEHHKKRISNLLWNKKYRTAQ